MCGLVSRFENKTGYIEISRVMLIVVVIFTVQRMVGLYLNDTLYRFAIDLVIYYTALSRVKAAHDHVNVDNDSVKEL